MFLSVLPALLFSVFFRLTDAQEPWSRRMDNDYNPDLEKFYEPATLRRHHPPPDPVITFTSREDRSIHQRVGSPEDAGSASDFSNQAVSESKSNAQFIDWNEMHSDRLPVDPSRGRRPESSNTALYLDELNGPIQADRDPYRAQPPIPVPTDAMLINRRFQSEPLYNDLGPPRRQFIDPDIAGMGSGLDYQQDPNLMDSGYQFNERPDGPGNFASRPRGMPFSGSSAIQKFQPIHEVEPPRFDSRNRDHTMQSDQDDQKIPVNPESTPRHSVTDSTSSPYFDVLDDPKRTDTNDSPKRKTDESKNLGRTKIPDSTEASRGSGFGQPSPPRQVVRKMGTRLNGRPNGRNSPRREQFAGSADTDSFRIADSPQPADRPDTRILLRPHRDRDAGSPSWSDDGPRSFSPRSESYQDAESQRSQEYFPTSMYPSRRGMTGLDNPQTAMTGYRRDHEPINFPPGFDSPLMSPEEMLRYVEPMRRSSPPRNDDGPGPDFPPPSMDQESGYTGDELPQRPVRPRLPAPRPRQRSRVPETVRKSPPTAPATTDQAQTGDSSSFAMANIFNPDPDVPRRPPTDQRNNWRDTPMDSDSMDGRPRRRQQTPVRPAVHKRRTPSKSFLEPALPASDFDRRFPVFTNDRLDGTQRNSGRGSMGRGRPVVPLTTEPGYVPVGKLRRFLYETSKLSGGSHEDPDPQTASREVDKVEPGYGPPNPDDTSDIDKAVNIGGS